VQYSVNLGLFSLNLVLQCTYMIMYIYTFGQNISKTSHTCTCTCTWSTIHVQIIDGHGWLAIVTGVATGNCMHRPEGMIQMKSMSRRCKVCSLFFSCIIWYFPKYFLLLCRVLYHPTVARLHTRFCLRSHPRTVVVEHTAVVRDSLEEFE
jgi:hypothetical protein